MRRCIRFNQVLSHFLFLFPLPSSLSPVITFSPARSRASSSKHKWTNASAANTGPIRLKRRNEVEHSGYQAEEEQLSSCLREDALHLLATGMFRQRVVSGTAAGSGTQTATGGSTAAIGPSSHRGIVTTHSTGTGR